MRAVTLRSGWVDSPGVGGYLGPTAARPVVGWDGVNRSHDGDVGKHSVAYERGGSMKSLKRALTGVLVAAGIAGGSLVGAAPAQAAVPNLQMTL